MKVRTLAQHCGAAGYVVALLLALVCAFAGSAQALPPPASAPAAPGPPAAAPAAPDATQTPTPAAATTFTLTGAPAGAEVSIDGQLVGTTPLLPRSPVSPGVHQLKVTRRGYSSYTREFTAYAGRMILLETDLVPTHMLVRVRTADAPAQVFVDDELRGDTPIEVELRPGPHQIQVRRANCLDQTWALTAVAGEEQEREVQLEIKPEQRRKEQASVPKERRYYKAWWVWTLAAIGAAGIATAIIVPTVLANRSDCDKLGGEVCFPIQLTAPTPAALTTALRLRF